LHFFRRRRPKQPGSYTHSKLISYTVHWSAAQWPQPKDVLDSGIKNNYDIQKKTPSLIYLAAANVSTQAI
jgi:hypothetical protein